MCHRRQGIQDKSANHPPKFRTGGTGLWDSCRPVPAPSRVSLEGGDGDGGAGRIGVGWTLGDPAAVLPTPVLRWQRCSFRVFRYSEGSCTKVKLLVFDCFRGRTRTFAGGLDIAGHGWEYRRGAQSIESSPAALGPVGPVPLSRD